MAEHQDTEPTTFPCCGAVHDARTGPDGVSPYPGSFAICCECWTVLIYGTDLKPEKVDTTKMSPGHRRAYERTLRVAAEAKVGYERAKKQN